MCVVMAEKDEDIAAAANLIYASGSFFFNLIGLELLKHQIGKKFLK